ncbi:MAG TPA: GatB/YqeY domain-containing protein [bacterium]|nr:GatB/YqeY domain-containing protein [bacterium]
MSSEPVVSPLRDEFKKALVESAKARDQVRLDTIRAVQSAVRYKEIEKKGTLTDPEILSVINTLCKQRRESIEQFKNGGRTELAEKEARELSILEKFLPAQLSKEDVEKAVAQVIKDLGASGASAMGNVMKETMKRLAGQADGKLVNEIVRSQLK